MTTRKAGNCLLTALLAAGAALADDRYSFAVIGDMPYAPTATNSLNQLVQAYPADAYQRVIADINSDDNDDKIDFTIHIGDIKAGNTLCSDDVYSQNLTYFNSFKRGLIFTPGDNEWTDCHRANNGSMDPLNRLALIRTTYFSTNQTLGQNRFNLTRQAGFPENAIWKEGPVVFVTLHQPGSNNNRNRTTGLFLDLTDSEYTARNAANMAWLDQAFALAAADNKVKGVAIFSQANPFERFLEPGQGYTVSGYADFIANLRSKALTSGKRVVYFGGDTHYMRIDQPLTGTYPACTTTAPPCTAVAVPGSPTDRVNNFSRIEVFAQNDVHWIKVEVSDTDPGVFKFTPRRVPGN
ncbi:MAG: hypothetical protein JNK48_11815 [Bryobacterales bacterium]|nr:hypothetical protein [Bryobacterales bacterium]